MGLLVNNKVVAQSGGFSTGANETWDNPESGTNSRFRRAYLGTALDYQKCVIPLVCLDQTYGIDVESYCSGRIYFMRNNGLDSFKEQFVDFKMQKEYSSTTTYHYTEFHRNSTYVKKCRFTWNGKPWAGFMIIPISIQAHMAWFSGMCINANGNMPSIGDSGYTWYIPYQRSNDSVILNSEIYNSLVNEG